MLYVQQIYKYIKIVDYYLDVQCQYTKFAKLFISSSDKFFYFNTDNEFIFHWIFYRIFYENFVQLVSTIK